METLRIFISGTQEDLQPERAAVGRAVDAITLATGIRAEKILSKARSPRTWIQEEIHACDIYVGVFSHRYGWVVPEENVSATEYEFNLARKLGKPILIWVRRLLEEEKGLSDFERQQQFLKRATDFSSGYVRQEFDEPAELEGFVSAALRDAIVRLVKQRTGTARPAPGPPPASPLIEAYLEEVARQRPYVLWGDQSEYIDRTVSKTEDLFARTVTPFEPQAPGPEEPQGPELLEITLVREGRLILLGEPGLGKTTSLLHLAWEAANWLRGSEAWASGSGIGIPIYVELKYYASEGELEELLARRVNEILRARNLMLAPDAEGSVRALKVWLTQPGVRFLFLLDGLNEVRPEYHRDARRLLQSLLYSPHQYVVACRERDYDQSLRDCAGAFSLQPLQYDEIQNYLTRTLGSGKGEQLFFADVITDWKMASLASNPLMLWLISMVAQSNPDVRLPANRGQLFRGFISHMPRIRASEGISLSVPFDVVDVVLAKLGFEMQERRTLTLDLSEARAFDLRTAGWRLEEVLAQAKEWRFLKSDGSMGGPVEFLHQLFLEYFAAEHMEHRLRAGQTFDDVIGDRHRRDWWGEALVMLAGITGRAAELVRWLCARSAGTPTTWTVLLATRCLETSGASQDGEAVRDVAGALIGSLRAAAQTDNEISVALERIGAPAVDLLIAELGTKNPVTRSEVLNILVRLGAHSVKPLIACLDRKAVRAAAADALGRIGDERAVEPLITLLRAGDPEARASAGPALVRIQSYAAVKPLVSTLLEGDVEARRQAAQALGEIANSTAAESLVRALKDEDAKVRGLAAQAIGRLELRESIHDESQAVEALIEALEDQDTNVRCMAAVALGEVGNARAVEGLVAALLKEGSHDVRLRALEALGSPPSILAEPSVCVGNLVAALQDENAVIRSRASAVLVRIGAPAVGPLLLSLRADNEKVRCHVVSILAEVAPSEVNWVAPLMVTDENAEVRRFAALTLWKTGDPSAVEPLIGALLDDDAQVRALAADALGKIGDPRALSPLMEATRDKDSAVRAASAFALGKLGDGRAAAPLLELLRDEDSQVCYSAAEALGEVGDRQALAELTRLSKESGARTPFGQVARAAHRAARRIYWRS